MLSIHHKYIITVTYTPYLAHEVLLRSFKMPYTYYGISYYEYYKDALNILKINIHYHINYIDLVQTLYIHFKRHYKRFKST